MAYFQGAKSCMGVQRVAWSVTEEEKHHGERNWQGKVHAMLLIEFLKWELVNKAGLHSCTKGQLETYAST